MLRKVCIGFNLKQTSRIKSPTRFQSTSNEKPVFTPVVARKYPFPTNLEPNKTYFWCACGLSKKQPFCDGSHKSTSFSPVQYQAAEAGPKWFCVCKQTAT